MLNLKLKKILLDIAGHALQYGIPKNEMKKQIKSYVQMELEIQKFNKEVENCALKNNITCPKCKLKCPYFK